MRPSKCRAEALFKAGDASQGARGGAERGWQGYRREAWPACRRLRAHDLML